MYDRYAINAELRRRGITHAVIGRKLGYTARAVGYVVSGRLTNARIRREIARVIGKPISTLWPSADNQRKAA